MSIRRIDILAHADFHGQFREDSENPGLSRFFSAVETIRSKNPQATLLLDAGDESKCLWKGKPVYKGLDLIKTDAMVLGNHEFDAGRKDLESYISYAKDFFPMLCANVIYKDNKQLINDTEPYAILDREGIKIGILGLSSSYTPNIVEKSAFADFEMTDSVETIRRNVMLMRKQGAEIIILLTHFPFYPDETGELFEVFKQIKDLDIDVFIGGHIPGDYGAVKDDCAIVKAGFHGVSLGHVTLYFDDVLRKTVDKQAEIIDVLNGPYGHNEKIDTFVKEVCEDYEPYFNDVIAEAKEDIIMHLSEESPMGDLLSDAFRDSAKTDFAYFNCTCCGRLIPKGNITRYSIQKAMAFNDYLFATEMKGSDLYDLFELIHKPEIFGSNANLMFSGLKVKIDHTRPYGNKVVWIKDYDDNTIDPDRIFTVVTSRYMSSGGNDTGSFTERFTFRKLDLLAHDAIADYFIKKSVIVPLMDNRYVFIGKPENDNSPW